MNIPNRSFPFQFACLRPRGRQRGLKLPTIDSQTRPTTSPTAAASPRVDNSGPTSLNQLIGDAIDSTTSTSCCRRSTTPRASGIDNKVPLHLPYNTQPSAAVQQTRILVINATASFNCSLLKDRRSARQRLTAGGCHRHQRSVRHPSTLDNSLPTSDTTPTARRGLRLHPTSATILQL